jgi:acetoacetyl-CoA synthetase
MSQPRPLWTPSPERCERSQLRRFLRMASPRTGRRLETYEEAWRWSVEDLEGFWRLAWEFLDPIARLDDDVVLVDADRMPGARFFPGAHLNFAENLLRFRDDRTALVFRREVGPTRRISYTELAGLVARARRGLAALGVRPGDRVAGFLPNVPETVVAMLAATSLGAVWSSSSPDFGEQGVLDRFGQIEPKVLFCADGHRYGGRSFDSLERVDRVVRRLPSLEAVVVVPNLCESPDLGSIPRAGRWADLLGPDDDPELAFASLPFDHPLYVMYSSGTTGLPKCMVQGAGGILLHQLKEHRLHVDLVRDDVLFYFTTCGWMMWNWLVAGLASGATLVLFDGNPFHPDPLALWRLAEDEGLTVFGTSAKYLAALEGAGARPRGQCDLSALRAVLSTGSPLSPEGFEFVYRDVKEDVQLASISGGTDLNGCFALGNPLDPVFAGELQCRGLAMAVESYGEDGRPVRGRQGELVCEKPFPSMPLRFWGDEDGAKYRAAYFERFPGVWHHGDFCEITDRGTVIITGRSDATLNPGGVRIGTADIYRVVEQLPEVQDSLVIGQDWEGDVRVVLFVRLREGCSLDEDLRRRMKQAIRSAASPRHVPAVILEVPDVPYTISGKKVELAVRDVVHGRPVKNRDALKNPEALEAYADRPELRA